MAYTCPGIRTDGAPCTNKVAAAGKPCGKCGGVLDTAAAATVQPAAAEQAEAAAAADPMADLPQPSLDPAEQAHLAAVDAADGKADTVKSARHGRWEARRHLSEVTSRLEGEPGLPPGEQASRLRDAGRHAFEAALQLYATATMIEQRDHDSWQQQKAQAGGLPSLSDAQDFVDVTDPAQLEGDVADWAAGHQAAEEASDADPDAWLNGLTDENGGEENGEGQ